MTRDKQIEMHELAKQMSEAISTAVEQRYIEDEAKLEAVLRANGWRKASDVAREIFRDIYRSLNFYKPYRELNNIIYNVFAILEEVEKKYESEGEG